VKKSGTRKKTRRTRGRRRTPELERYGQVRWVPIQQVEGPHGVRYPHHLVRLMRSFKRHKGWHGRPLLVERVAAGSRKSKEIRFVSWTGSHRLAAAFAMRVWMVPIIEMRGRLWDDAHGPAQRGSSRLSETYDDEQRLAMILCTRDERAIRLMDREVPRDDAHSRARRRSRRAARMQQGPPWAELGPRLEARVLQPDVVELRHRASSETRVFGREVLEKLLALLAHKRAA
jgi:hypothetical protein